MLIGRNLNRFFIGFLSETKVGSSIGSSDVVSIMKEELRNVDGKKKEPSTQPEMVKFF